MVRVRGGKKVVASDEQPRTTEFIRTVRHIMVDRDIRNPNVLHRLMRDQEPYPARATVHGYFNGAITPQPWFLRSFTEVCERLGKPLTPEEDHALNSTYIASY